MSETEEPEKTKRADTSTTLERFVQTPVIIPLYVFMLLGFHTAKEIDELVTEPVSIVKFWALSVLIAVLLLIYC